MYKLADIFYKAAEIQPDKTAIWCDNNSITYRELVDLVSQYSNFLLSNNIVYRDHIGIPMTNSIHSVALILAAANLGVGLVPINPTLPIDAIKAAFYSANIKHLIARQAFFENCDKNGGLEILGEKICIDGKLEGTQSLLEADKMSKERPIVEHVTGDEILIITMTSGSTGAPKPISLSQKNKYERAMAHIDLYKITQDDNVLAATPLYHSLAERLVLIPLLLGGTSVLLPRFTPNIWINCVKEQSVTFTIAVSAQLNQIAAVNDNSLNGTSLRCLVSSSSLLESHVKNQLIEKLHCDFHEMYGTSEVSTVTSINLSESIHKKQSVGKPIPGADVVIFKDNGEVATAGEIGEIGCKTRLLCEGYYKMDEVFEKSIQNNYFKTGDVGYLDEDGYLYFSGRKKEIIITGGINVYPQDIEKCVFELPEVRECAAFSYPDEKLGEIVALAIVINEGSEINQRKVQRHCAKNLADFQQPHKIIFLNELPKNSMGKLVRAQLIHTI
ncbi:class I adenylate-forming enzyme family protein [Robertmurraya korlensis]|uniref:class I adenylate-forming enzyme family protein n=1 Tax=Robertmurraya korlensis TaxID=519977 RepID=UPI000826D88A|nr:class I adenylate-forming enzyme family protein [Robertmurraya korlensis]